MYIRRVTRKNRDGSEVAYYQLVKSYRHPDTGKPRTKVLLGLGREDQLDRDSLQRLAKGIHGLLADDGTPGDLASLGLDGAKGRFVGIHGLVPAVFLALGTHHLADALPCAQARALATAVSRRAFRISTGGTVDDKRRDVPGLASALMYDLGGDTPLASKVPLLPDILVRASQRTHRRTEHALVSVRRRRYRKPADHRAERLLRAAPRAEHELPDDCWMLADGGGSSHDEFGVLVCASDGMPLAACVVPASEGVTEALRWGAAVARAHGASTVIGHVCTPHDHEVTTDVVDHALVATRLRPDVAEHQELAGAPGRYRHVDAGVRSKAVSSGETARRILVRHAGDAREDRAVREVALDIAAEVAECAEVCTTCDHERCPVQLYLIEGLPLTGEWNDTHTSRTDGATLLTSSTTEVPQEDLVRLWAATESIAPVLERMLPPPTRREDDTHVQASIDLTIAALQVMHWVQAKTGKDYARVAETLATIHDIRLQVGDQEMWTRAELTEDQSFLVEALEVGPWLCPESPVVPPRPGQGDFDGRNARADE